MTQDGPVQIQLRGITVEDLKEFTRWIAGIIIRAFLLMVFVLSVVSITPAMQDDSDQKGWFAERSNLIIRTDYLTGCQYLVSRDGITPRLDPSGRQVCRDDLRNK